MGLSERIILYGTHKGVSMNQNDRGYGYGMPGTGINVIRTKAGYIGQVTVGNEIAWESPAYNEEGQAYDTAKDRVTERMLAFFGDD